MATNTTNYNFKKPDESDFYSVQDQNNNWDKADAALKDLDTPTFEDYSGSTTVPDAATAINNIKSKGKLSTIVSNVKAAFKGACLIGQIVNNCVTNNAKLPLSAAQGKALMDLYTQLNSDLASITGLIVKDITLNPGYAIYGTWATRIIKDKSSGICVINLAIRKADNSVINTNTYVDIGILPDGFLPIYPTGASGIGEEPGAINHPVGIILFEGKIKATTYGENTRNIIASFSYSTN
ncbi:hypothetical protein CE91St54_66220 [Hungatella hathewayi]|jgi:hypothetical protein|uniref:Tail fiber protein n=1 Tax=Hungatella hathewayi TaxID=154046 RepID=A0AA37JMT4_9FIRM|nr:hypothetical protein [Hungatella hathewayi]GKH02038.1 hypothetical protein CE91St55_40190 [Hungatella hathewayi]GKH11514.1 hypothetical protein CE91St54_66220 [Hungatella hathewayi]